MINRYPVESIPSGRSRKEDLASVQLWLPLNNQSGQPLRSKGVEKTPWPKVFVNYLLGEKKKDRNGMHLN